MRSLAEAGTKGIVIDVECQLSNGLPNIIIVGFANKAVDEAKERIRSAFASTQLVLPRKRITINLAPADLPKDSTGFDLAIATAILIAGQQTKQVISANSALFGELSLDGKLRPVRGIIGKILAGRDQGLTTFFIPEANLEQAMLIPEVTLVPIRSVKDIYLYLNQSIELAKISTKEGVSIKPAPMVTLGPNLSDVIGQQQAKRALAIAAAGGHNVLLNGPPGTGKSMLAKALPSILPPLKREEILEITHLHSLANKDYDQIITTRPFRSPHHSASDTAIIGGGQNPRPGEISLAHHGVLLFDEFPEFSRTSIEALRQPLEDRMITVARAKDSVSYPANFILIATANPCPCGYWGTSKPCQCLPHHIQRYQRKISGPIIDRIDMHVSVDEVAHERLLDNTRQAEQTEVRLRQRIIRARELQARRFGDHKLNKAMTNADIKKHAQLAPEAKALLDQAATHLDISARSYMRAIKVARTVADLEASPTIEPVHVAEALRFRAQISSAQLQVS